jgi:hypothetical protein
MWRADKSRPAVRVTNRKSIVGVGEERPICAELRSVAKLERGDSAARCALRASERARRCDDGRAASNSRQRASRQAIVPRLGMSRRHIEGSGRESENIGTEFDKTRTPCYS